MLIDIAEYTTPEENAKLLYGLGAGEELSPAIFPMRVAGGQTTQYTPAPGTIVFPGGATGAVNASGGSGPGIKSGSSIISQVTEGIARSADKVPAFITAMKGGPFPQPDSNQPKPEDKKMDYTPLLVVGGGILALGALFLVFKKR